MPYTTTASGLQFEDLVVGTGPEARPGRNVVVHYTGWLYEGGRRAPSSIPARTAASPSSSRSARAW